MPRYARLAKAVTALRPYLCEKCGWQGWRFPSTDRDAQEQAPSLLQHVDLDLPGVADAPLRVHPLVVYVSPASPETRERPSQRSRTRVRFDLALLVLRLAAHVRGATVAVWHAACAVALWAVGLPAFARQRLGAMWRRTLSVVPPVRAVAPRALAPLAIVLGMMVVTAWALSSFSRDTRMPAAPLRADVGLASEESNHAAATSAFEGEAPAASSEPSREQVGSGTSPTSEWVPIEAPSDSAQAVSTDAARAARPASPPTGSVAAVSARRSSVRPNPVPGRSRPAVARSNVPSANGPAAGRVPAQRVVGQTPAGAPARYRGALAIDSAPEGARVFLNHQAIGSTPLTVDDLPVGSHVVRIEADGYQRWSAAVRVVASRHTRVTARLHQRADQ